MELPTDRLALSVVENQKISEHLHARRHSSYAFADTYPSIFWSGAISLGIISYFIVLYFVTSPDWPVGKVLGLEKIKPRIIRIALVVNFALASIILAGSSVTLYLLVPAIGVSSQQPVYEKAILEAQKLETAGQAVTLRKNEIRKEAIGKIWTSGFGMLEKLFGAISGALGCVVGSLALRQSKAEPKLPEMIRPVSQTDGGEALGGGRRSGSGGA